MIETDLVEWIRKHAGVRHSRLVLGIGDDCAIFRPRPGEDLLVTTDQLIEDVHFLKKTRPETIGERALARSLSDIAAMGGEPRFCLVSLAVPSRKGTRWMHAFFRGLLALARRTNTPFAGGDLAHDVKVHCDVMVCGGVAQGKALRRDGARPGDGVYVSGRLGKPWDRRIEPRLSLGPGSGRQGDRLHRFERTGYRSTCTGSASPLAWPPNWIWCRCKKAPRSNVRCTAGKITNFSSQFRTANRPRRGCFGSAPSCAARRARSLTRAAN